MQVNTCATHYTYVPGNSVNVLIANGQSIIVHGVFVSFNSTTLCTLREADGVTVITTIRSGPALAYEMRTPWVAKNGLTISNTTINSVTTVYYSFLGT